MVWWLDDGSIIRGGRKEVICTNSFHPTEISLLSQYLLEMCQIKTTLLKVQNKEKTKKYMRLYFSSTQEFQKFILIIIPHIPIPQMLYKVLIIYKKPNDQQRWISVMKKSLPQFQKEIDILISQKSPNLL